MSISRTTLEAPESEEEPDGPAAKAGRRQVRRGVEAAWGEREPGLVLQGGRVLLPSGEILRRDLAILGSEIVAIAEGLDVSGASRIDVNGKTIVPGYVEPHAHILGPLGLAAYLSCSLARGTTSFTTDDSYLYEFLTPAQYERVLDSTVAAPAGIQWSLRPDPGARTISHDDLIGYLDRPEVTQVGELSTRPDLEEPPDGLVALLAAARARGLTIEGHTPGGSPRTLGAAAAAGITSDHEAIDFEEVRDRLRGGIWAMLRHNGLRPDIPEIVPGLMASGLSLEHTALTTDGPTPGWMAVNGTTDAAIRAAIGAGMPPAEAYSCATYRPATYGGLGTRTGHLAPGRFADLNILGDLEDPTPERVYRRGIEVARDGKLTVEVPEVPWEEIGAGAWSRRRSGPPSSIFEPHPDDLDITLKTRVITREGAGAGEPSTCLAIDPESERYTRARIFGLPDNPLAIASTVTPERVLIGVGGEAAALAGCFDAVIEAGGGIAFGDGRDIHLLPLPIGGVISSASFEEVAGFWLRAERLFADLGYEYGDPIQTLLFLASDSLPGPRFVAGGLVDTRSGRVLTASRPVGWTGSPAT